MEHTLPFVIVSPGGNLTGLVIGRVPPRRYTGLSGRLMRKNAGLEQVGFIVPSRMPGVLAKLDMMGQEFCGNAARALGYIITRGLVPNVAPPALPADMLLEVSGTGRPVRCRVTAHRVQLDVPVPEFTPVHQACQDFHIVHLEGISYVVVSGRTGDRRDARRLLTHCHFRPLRAAGVVYYRRQARRRLAMETYVYVAATRTWVAETASGTSAVAVGIVEAYRERGAKHTYTLVPPSGVSVRVTVERRGDAVARATINGPVVLVDVRRITLAGVCTVRGGFRGGRRGRRNRPLYFPARP